MLKKYFKNILKTVIPTHKGAYFKCNISKMFLNRRFFEKKIVILNTLWKYFMKILFSFFLRIRFIDSFPLYTLTRKLSRNRYHTRNRSTTTVVYIINYYSLMNINNGLYYRMYPK